MQDSQGIVDWLYGTALSSAIRDTSWIVPAVQAIHICAIAVVVSCALVTELRIAGVIAPDESVNVIAQRYLPWMWRSLVVLVGTGLVMVIGEPGRVLHNEVFWVKMALVATGMILSLVLRRPLLAAADTIPRRPAKSVAWMLLVLWVAVIFSGRWIAYT
jgi:hypothetical protein